MTAAQIAAALGRDRKALLQHTRRSGLDSLRRLWTEAEREQVRQRYLTEPAHAIARDLGRSPRSIHNQAGLLGLAKWPRWPDATIERVRQLHTEGLCDAEIGRQMAGEGLLPGKDARSQATHIRRVRLKLPKNREAIYRAQLRGVQSQARSLGVTVGGGLRKLAYRVFARQNGWPEDCRPREVQILNVLAARGVPMTARELAEAIGMSTGPFRSGKRRILLSSNGPGGTYTADLVRRGLVSSLRRGGTVTGRGRGRSVHLYLLGPVALAILEERAQCQDSNNIPCASMTPAV